MTADDNTIPPDTIATLRIDLLDSDPPIWREVEVLTLMTLKQLHAVIQAAMGWEDSHLWEFEIARERIGSGRAAKLRLHELLGPRKTRFTYIYDFGDCWEHQLTLTRTRAAEPGASYPRYVGGERAAPPDDCGGIPGFYAQLVALADPNHPDHEEVKEWLGDYDPEAFDELSIKNSLARIANRRGAARQKTRER
jgi:hypothetical protein